MLATSDRLETWLIPSGTTRSRQNLQVNHGLTQRASVTLLLVLCLLRVEFLIEN